MFVSGRHLGHRRSRYLDIFAIPSLSAGSPPVTSIKQNPIFLIVVLAGTMGAFFSALQRLYDFKELPRILYEKDLVDAYGTLFIY